MNTQPDIDDFDPKQFALTHAKSRATKLVLGSAGTGAFYWVQRVRDNANIGWIRRGGPPPDWWACRESFDPKPFLTAHDAQMYLEEAASNEESQSHR